jgi:hypothetical protein
MQYHISSNFFFLWDLIGKLEQCLDDYERFYFLSELNLEGSMRENLMAVIKKNEELYEKIDEAGLRAKKCQEMESIAVQEVESFKELVKNLKLKNEGLKNANEDLQTRIDDQDLQISGGQKQTGELQETILELAEKNDALDKEKITLEKYKSYYEGVIDDNEIANFKYIKDNFPVSKQANTFYDAIMMLKARLTRHEREAKKKDGVYSTLSANFKRMQEKVDFLNLKVDTETARLGEKRVLGEDIQASDVPPAKKLKIMFNNDAVVDCDAISPPADPKTDNFIDSENFCANSNSIGDLKENDLVWIKPPLPTGSLFGSHFNNHHESFKKIMQKTTTQGPIRNFCLGDIRNPAKTPKDESFYNNIENYVHVMISTRDETGTPIEEYKYLPKNKLTENMTVIQNSNVKKFITNYNQNLAKCQGQVQAQDSHILSNKFKGTSLEKVAAGLITKNILAKDQNSNLRFPIASLKTQTVFNEKKLMSSENIALKFIENNFLRKNKIPSQFAAEKTPKPEILASEPSKWVKLW